jgi:phosphoglycolate phosphatase
MREPLAGLCVLFDLDGTLVDTAGDLAASMNFVLRQEGLRPAPLESVRHLIGHGARAMLKAGLAEAGAPPASEEALDAAVAAFVAHYRENIAVASRPFPGAIEAIETLRTEGASIAVCTNKREALARTLIGALGLSRHFDAIVGGDTAGAAKPDPRPVRRCLQETGGAAGVLVGDSDTDIKAAAAAGIPCLAARFGYGPLDLCDEALAVFSTYDELPPLVRWAAARRS